VPLRSRPAAIVPFRLRSGGTSFRVTATIRGKQRKKEFITEADALACQQLWEQERVHGAAASRPKLTALTPKQGENAGVKLKEIEGQAGQLLLLIKNLMAKGMSATYAEELTNSNSLSR
jgi:hypothetical protein